MLMLGQVPARGDLYALLSPNIGRCALRLGLRRGRAAMPTEEVTVTCCRQSSASQRLEDRIATAGDHGPTSGAWTTSAWPPATAVIRQGEVVPSLHGAAVEWRYAPARKGPPLLEPRFTM